MVFIEEGILELIYKGRFIEFKVEIDILGIGKSIC